MSISDDSLFFNNLIEEHNNPKIMITSLKMNEPEIPKGMLEGTPEFAKMIAKQLVHGKPISKVSDQKAINNQEHLDNKNTKDLVNL